MIRQAIHVAGNAADSFEGSKVLTSGRTIRESRPRRSHQHGIVLGCRMPAAPSLALPFHFRPLVNDVERNAPLEAVVVTASEDSAFQGERLCCKRFLLEKRIRSGSIVPRNDF